MTVAAFSRKLRVGTFSPEQTGSVELPVVVSIEWDGTRLSLSGEVGRGGSFSGGQIVDLVAEVVRLARPLTVTDRDRLVAEWRRWHLNDMRAGCSHQRDAGWDQRPIDPTKPLNAYGRFFLGQKSDTWNMLAWVRPDEHPEGLLTKECETCGYAYGSAWLLEPVPNDVVAWLATVGS